MKVSELIWALEKHNPNREVEVWLPGSTISLKSVFGFVRDGKVQIEGNLNPGSALEADHG